MKTTLRVLQPEYCGSFSCIGGACENNCCFRNWDIHIDKKTYNTYRNTKDAQMAAKLKLVLKRRRGDNVTDGTYAQFDFGEDKQCPFQVDGLCEIQLKLGHKALSRTCQTYPRMYSLVKEEFIEESISMSCPAAVRAALFNEKPMEFVLVAKEFDTEHGMLPIPSKPLEEYTGFVWATREACIDIMQNRGYTLSERIFTIGMLLQKITKLHEEGKDAEIPAAVDVYRTAAKAGEFHQLGDFPKSEGAAQEIRTILYSVIIANAQVKKEPTYEPLREFVREMFQQEEQSEVPEDEEYYMEPYMHHLAQQRAAAHWERFLKEKGHVLENYFVNHIFSSIFPFAGDTVNYAEKMTPYQQFCVLAQQYALLRIVLCGLADEENGICDALITRVVSCIAHLGVHSSALKQVATQYYNGEALGSLANMYFLLKD